MQSPDQQGTRLPKHYQWILLYTSFLFTKALFFLTDDLCVIVVTHNFKILLCVKLKITSDSMQIIKLVSCSYIICPYTAVVAGGLILS